MRLLRCARNDIFLVALVVLSGGAVHADMWDDGRAEVAFYDTVKVVNDKPRKFRERLITSRERLPGGKKGIEVLRLNIVENIELENFPINAVTSVYVDDKTRQEPLKLVVGYQEWGGTVYKVYDKESGRLRMHLPAGAVSDIEAPVEIKKNVYFEEQLPLSLRELDFSDGYTDKIQLVSAVSNKDTAAPTLTDVTLMVSKPEPIRGHAGSLDSWKVELTSEKGTDTYWFEKKSPHIMTKMKTKDGHERMIYGRHRWSYWDHRIPKAKILQ